MKILFCPGQGSQSEGFLIPWIDSVPGFKAKLGELSDACGKDLVRLGTTAAEEEIKDTANAQPLIVGASIAAYSTALAHLEFEGVVGHSVGEFAAAAVSGVLSESEAMHLVSIRANAMAEAASEQQTSMAAVLGGDQSEIEALIASMGLQVANYNGGGQIVAAGLKDRIANLVASPPERVRVIELKVAGAFHTSYMQSAVEVLGLEAAKISPKDPKLALWSNRDGSKVSSGAEFLESLVSQVSSPVRWDLCMQDMQAEATQVVELPPAGALAGLAKRGMPNTVAVALKTPTDLEKIG
jgi:[acyl-carrier-protein] S-malonyltransferase